MRPPQPSQSSSERSASSADSSVTTSPAAGNETDSRLTRWEDGWSSGRYSKAGQSFHQAAPHPALIDFFDRLALTPNAEDLLAQERVLVPLCGKSVDMVYIAEMQHCSALGLEAVPRAISEFAAEATAGGAQVSPTRHLHSTAQHWRFGERGGYVAIAEGDALEFTATRSNLCSAIWDRAALVALRRSDRAAYVAMCARSVKPGSFLLLTVVSHDMMVPAEPAALGGVTPYGPPFSLSTADVHELYESNGFTFREELRCEEKLSEEPRWAAKGATYFNEVCYLLQRKDDDEEEASGKPTIVGVGGELSTAEMASLRALYAPEPDSSSSSSSSSQLGTDAIEAAAAASGMTASTPGGAAAPATTPTAAPAAAAADRDTRRDVACCLVERGQWTTHMMPREEAQALVAAAPSSCRPPVAALLGLDLVVKTRGDALKIFGPGMESNVPICRLMIEPTTGQTPHRWQGKHFM